MQVDVSSDSIYVDCTRLRRTIEQAGEWPSLSVTAYPELDDRTTVCSITLG